CNVSIAKGILDEVGYIVNTSIHNDGVGLVVIGATTGQGAYVLNDATSPRRYKTMASTDGFFVSTRGGGRVTLFGLTLVSGEAAYAEFYQPGWVRSAKK
ncbi:MAG: hypothetical protein KBT27_12210, partial [Prevotellaceae bacterium]|nr:hypothetical protein [Candidatus Faecinaster equi]